VQTTIVHELPKGGSVVYAVLVVIFVVLLVGLFAFRRRSAS
jgi:hypothetical protein